jgi:Holliday junction DNA helicase RuvB
MEKKLEDINLRPKNLEEYIGQEEIKKQLKVFIEASKKLNKPLDHILITGYSGLGKTSLAQVIANELNRNIVITSAPILDKKGDIAGILSSLNEGDILFIDEIHRLNPSIEELLYSAMEDYVIDIVIGKKTTAKTIRLELPKFTLIGATTKAGMLTSPLLSRFGIILNMNFYTIDEIKRIIKRSATILNAKISEEGTSIIAKASRGIPRIANQLLKRIYDFAIYHNREIIDKETAEKGLKFLGYNELGLNQIDIKYLEILVKKFNMKPVGLNTLIATLSLDRYTIEEIIEPYLLRLGLIEKTPRGRAATEEARKLIEKM